MALAALRALTINHRNAGLGGLQDFSIDSDRATDLHQQLFNRQMESVLVRTCNRTELYWRARMADDDRRASAALAQAIGIDEPALTAVSTRLAGEHAARHLFRVCCGLESLVLGEAEILGQVRSALDASPHAGPFLTGVVRAAVRAAGSARAETAIGVGAMSVASMAIHWLNDVLPLAGRRVLVVGAGETGQKAARLLRSLQVGHLVVANRTLARAVTVAKPFGATAVGLESLAVEIGLADAIVCAASADDWLIRCDDLRAPSTRPAPLVVVDLAMPAGVERGDVAGVVRMDLEGLQALVDGHRRQRESEIPAVEAVIARELEWLRTWARHHALRPLMSELRRKVEAIRRAEVARIEEEVGPGRPIDAAALDRLSRRLMDQVLAIPLTQLEDPDKPIDPAQAQYLRQLFSLEAS
ncbi:MAG TPA: glutamyl-tRNA reductase [Vicinamibacterales bacterium]|nr:glutamyl-tRNA reductase [Vicinamibacterales bacterium]